MLDKPNKTSYFSKISQLLTRQAEQVFGSFRQEAVWTKRVFTLEQLL